ncbi:GNAT family N-acetyltransferase [Maribellus sp. YY47]|uniref:GNAT family N-acetyltransferase n=1 Tax=Maribellus sp. YY47 TaxID=2929486 RepID=UPI0020006D4E|nr:GNAT family N-acetyltransferase [Maribellus sp. YY47]MCK3685411.1 GNAT family N-acetyltransferase [Maribellus sp. YY47]
MQIETERLLIREMIASDLEHLLKIYGTPVNMKFIPNSNCDWSLDKLREKYEKANCNYSLGFGIFTVVDKQTKAIIGEAGLFNSFQDLKHLELGYILDKKFWGLGYGTEVCNALINYGFEKLKLEKLTARMIAANTASARLAEKCGMKLIDKGTTDTGVHFLGYETNKPS